MATNTLTSLYPDIMVALDMVAREMIGFIPAVTRNSSAARAAIGHTMRFPIAPSAATGNIVAGVTPPDDGAQTFDNLTLTVSKSKYAPVQWTGEEQLQQEAGNTYNTMLRDQFAQAMRALVNEVEADIAALYVNSSRAYGAGGTTPFGTAANFTEFAGVQRILDDNGAPSSDRHLVLGSAAIANIRGVQSGLYKANEAGTDDLLRRGEIAQVMGLGLHNSAQVKTHTKGAGTGYLINGTTMVSGITGLIVDTGSGTVLAGDHLTQTSDTNKYIVKTGCTGSGVLITINKPGLVAALADNLAITVGTSYAANLAFHRSAINLMTRTPAMPAGGDMADDVIEVQDPISGLAFQVAMYREYRRVKYEVGLAWGCACVKPEFLATLLG